MSWEIVEKHWSDLHPRVKARWKDLTPEDLETVAGRRDELARRIQDRYRIEKKEADRQIEDWLNEPGVLDDWNDRRAILDM